jgi:hypothetical protein
MDLSVQLHHDTSLGISVGRFEDLEYLVKMLNKAWESVKFRFEEMEGKAGHYLFIRDSKESETAEVGVVERRGEEVFAFTPAVHQLIMGSYEQFVEEFGDPTL